MIAELISTLLENYIYDVTSSGVKNWFDKQQQKKFFKDTRNDIVEFCNKNECVYLNSGAFDYYIRNTRFVERVIERELVTKIDISNEDFINAEIKKARVFAESENVVFSNYEERIIKDLYYLIADKSGNYYRSKLSIEQRHMVSVCLEGISNLQNSVDEIKEKSLSNQNVIINMLKSEIRLSDAKSVIIADLFFKEICDGRFSEFENLAQVVKDKSDDLNIYYECLSQIICSENCSDSVNKIARIGNVQIRDNAIRIALPFLLFRKEIFDSILEFISSGSLKEIVKCLINGDTEGIFTESIVYEKGLEIHNITVNKKLLLEEEWLTKQIAVQFLYDKKIRNVYNAMGEIENGGRTWLSKILIADREIEKYIGEYTPDNDEPGLEELLDSLKSQRYIYDYLCGCMRAFYYSVLVKIYLLINRLEDAERIIPEEIKQYRPLSDYVLAIKNEKKEVNLEDIYEYSVKNDTYWLINNYFVSRKDSEELVLFCRKHEELFDKDMSLLFMYLGALKILGEKEERMLILKKYSTKLQFTYEYWNEILDLDSSEQIQRQFIDACREGKMNGMLVASEYFIIERLLNFGEYDIADIYLQKREKIGESDYKTKKYKAIIEQGKKNDVEAIKWYKASFADNPKDIYVIDSLITLSLLNKRNVEKRVIEAAVKANTSRLHMLVAACYLSEGKISEAKNENIKSILMSEEDYNPAFGQFLAIETRFDKKDVVDIKSIEASTAAYCRNKDGNNRWLCVYKDNILPSSPYIWNNDFHVYIDDAAGFGYLRKQKGNHIEIDQEDYEVIEIITIDAYLFRTCISKMTQKGFAKEISIPSKDGKFDISAFNEWIVRNMKDERVVYDWLEQYNNVQDVPLPLFVYKRFTKMSYLQFVDKMLSTKNIFIRETLLNSTQADKYIISFSALVALFKAGLPVDEIVNSGGAIMESTFMQIESDVSDIIEEYNRDTVASFGVIDGKVFYNQVDDSGKDFWLKEAGLIKKYCESIPIVHSEKDLAGTFFDGFDSKELLGICDYDAISFVIQNEDYSLVTMEAMLHAMSENEDVQLKVITISDWLVEHGVDAIDLLSYVKKLMDMGCLMSVTKNVIKYVSEAVQNESIRNIIYSEWDVLLSAIDNYPESHKMIAIQALSEVFASFGDETLQIDKELIHILVKNLLLLRKQKIEAFIDEKGYLTFAIVNINPEEQMAEVNDEE